MFQLHQIFNLAHSFRMAVQKDRPLDYILKVIIKNNMDYTALCMLIIS